MEDEIGREDVGLKNERLCWKGNGERERRRKGECIKRPNRQKYIIPISEENYDRPTRPRHRTSSCPFRRQSKSRNFPP